MAGQMASMGAAADPRLSISADAIGSYSNRVLATLHDPMVKFEEYFFYAQKTRASERDVPTQKRGITRFIPGMQTGLESTPGNTELKELPVEYPDDKTGATIQGRRRSNVVGIVDDEEWLRASRAARTATWGAVFYLITTDILGPFSTPWAFSQLGWGPGASLYIIFGALAGYSGYQIWQMFLGLDSDRYPLKNYGDIAFRIYGNWARYVCNILQSLQFFLNVGLIILGTALGISQVITGAGKSLCFVVCSIVFTIAGCLVGQIRTLARFGWLANIAVWINLLTMFFVMGVASHSSPNYTAVYAFEGGVADTATAIPGYFGDGGAADPVPIRTSAGVPEGLTFQNNVVGLMQAVFSYGGATLFCEILAEMRRPYDFWKGLLAADVLIFCCYLFYGMFVYGYQGQFAYQISYQGINPYGWQTACNIMQLISSLIAACLYGNIGIKVLYANIGRDMLKWPALESHRGKLLWVMLVPIYWVAAFAVSSSIPQFTNFSALVGALCILQFTYTFPPLLMIGFNSQKDAMLPEESFDPNNGVVNRVDSGWKRAVRGFRKKLLLNTWDLLYGIGALVTAILGIYSAIFNMVQSYKTNPNAVAWGCTPQN